VALLVNGIFEVFLLSRHKAAVCSLFESISLHTSRPKRFLGPHAGEDRASSGVERKAVGWNHHKVAPMESTASTKCATRGRRQVFQTPPLIDRPVPPKQVPGTNTPNLAQRLHRDEHGSAADVVRGGPPGWECRSSRKDTADCHPTIPKYHPTSRRQQGLLSGRVVFTDRESMSEIV